MDDQAWLIALFEEAERSPMEPEKPAQTVQEEKQKPTCNRCGGRGVIPYYSHVRGGVCFACSGSGYR